MSKEEMPSSIKRSPADMHQDGVGFDPKIKAAKAADKREAENKIDELKKKKDK